MGKDVEASVTGAELDLKVLNAVHGGARRFGDIWKALHPSSDGRYGSTEEAREVERSLQRLKKSRTLVYVSGTGWIVVT